MFESLQHKAFLNYFPYTVIVIDEAILQVEVAPSLPHSQLTVKNRQGQAEQINKKSVFTDILYKGGYSSIGRTTVCGTVSSLFNSGYPP